MGLLGDGDGERNISTVASGDFSMQSETVCFTSGRAVLSMLGALG